MVTSWTPWLLKMGAIVCSETSVRNYDSTLGKIPEEHRSQNSALFYSAEIFYIFSSPSLGALRLLRFPFVQSKTALSAVINRQEDLRCFTSAVFFMPLSKSCHSRHAVLSCLSAVTHAVSRCCMVQEQAFEAVDVIKSGHIAL